MTSLRDALAAAVAEHGFSGVVRVDRGGRTELAEAFGPADRAHAVPNTVGTRFALASVSKGFTAVVAVSLVAEGRWSLDTAVRPLLGDDLPEVPDEVTVEHLLGHRSGIGDYVDESDDAEITDYVLQVPVHTLVDTEDYLRALAGHPPRSAVDEEFSYNNSGFVVLALLTERLTGTPFHGLVAGRVLEPAGMTATAYLRSDELPGGAARGYLGSDGLRSNILHLPVRGSGDGGAYSTVEDLARFWRAFASGRLVPPTWVAEMTRPRGAVPDEQRHYGLGVWLDDVTGGMFLEGYDAGVSARTLHDPGADLTWSVVSNTSDDAWLVARSLAELLAG